MHSDQETRLGGDLCLFTREEIAELEHYIGWMQGEQALGPIACRVDGAVYDLASDPEAWHYDIYGNLIHVPERMLDPSLRRCGKHARQLTFACGAQR